MGSHLRGPFSKRTSEKAVKTKYTPRRPGTKILACTKSLSAAGYVNHKKYTTNAPIASQINPLRRRLQILAGLSM